MFFCPGITKTNNRTKVKKKLFLKASPHSSTSTSSKSNISIELKEVSVSLNKLSCSFIEKFSHKGEGGKTTWEERSEFGKDIKGEIKKKGPRGGWTAETGKRGKGGWEAEKDNWEGGWEKVKGGWGKGKDKGGWKGGKTLKKKSSLSDGFDDDMSPNYVPNKKRTYTKSYNKVNQPTGIYTQPDQRLRGTKLI